MVVLQDKGSFAFYLGQFIDERREHDLRWKMSPCLQQWESRLANILMQCLAGGYNVPPEAHGIVIARVERYPCNTKRILAFVVSRNPLAYKRRFAKSCRSRQQGKFVFQPFVKPRKQGLAHHE